MMAESEDDAGRQPPPPAVNSADAAAPLPSAPSDSAPLLSTMADSSASPMNAQASSEGRSEFYFGVSPLSDRPETHIHLFLPLSEKIFDFE